MSLMKAFSTGLRRTGTAILLSLIVAGFAVADASPKLSSSQKTEVLESIRHELETRAFVPNVDFGKWDSYVAKYKKQIDAAKTDDEFAFAVESAIQAFGVSHIALITPAAATARVDHSVIGIGISFYPQPNGTMTVTRVFPQSAAGKGGLIPGDTIIGVDGHSDKILERIRGPKGSTVSIKVKHADGSDQTYKLIRQPFDTTIPPTLQKVNDTTDIITIPTFDVTYSASTVDDLMKSAQNVPNLIIDLRSNPGGAVLNMLDFLGLTLKPGTAIGEIVTSKEVKEYQKEHPGKVDVAKVAAGIPDQLRLRVSPMNSNQPYYTGHIAVLIDQASGSAAEISAQALKETRDATVVGSKSAGAVLVSIIQPIKDGFSLQYPLFDYVSVGGVRLEGHGVIPDVEAKTPIVPDIKNDPAIQAAAKALLAKDKEDPKTTKVLDLGKKPAA